MTPRLRTTPLARRLALLLSAVNVYFRDIASIMETLMLAWFFLTPIFYPPSLFPRAARLLLLVNPLAVLMDAYRAILLRGAWPDPAPLLLLALWAAALFSSGFWLFRRLQPGFADAV